MNAKEFLKKQNITDVIINKSDLPEYWKSISDLIEEYQALQLQQTGVMACFSEEQLSQINKYGKHQHNRGAMDLSYVSFEFWLK